MSPRIQVAVGVLRNRRGDILLSRRKQGQHLEGYWEFPGGKVEEGESAPRALARELKEELGIDFGAAEKLIGIPFDYAEKKVQLDVYTLDDWAGIAEGREGQDCRWVPGEELRHYRLPEANRGILTALALPQHILISGEFDGRACLRRKIDAALRRGIELIQLRAPCLAPPEYVSLCHYVKETFQTDFPRVKFFANCSVELFPHTGFRYLHLSVANLQGLTADSRPPQAELLSSAVHDEQQLLRAQQLGVDFVYLSPVRMSQTHPQSDALGWARFAALCARARVPVIALGGLGPEDLPAAREAGAQGVAAIRAWW